MQIRIKPSQVSDVLGQLAAGSIYNIVVDHAGTNVLKLTVLPTTQTGYGIVFVVGDGGVLLTDLETLFGSGAVFHIVDDIND